MPKENNTVVLNHVEVEKQGGQLKKDYLEKAIKVFSSEHEIEPLTFWIMYFWPKRPHSVPVRTLL